MRPLKISKNLKKYNRILFMAMFSVVWMIVGAMIYRYLGNYFKVGLPPSMNTGTYVLVFSSIILSHLAVVFCLMLLVAFGVIYDTKRKMYNRTHLDNNRGTEKRR